MRLLFVLTVFSILSASVFAQTKEYGKECPPLPAYPGKEDAVEFARALDSRGFTVEKIARSKLEGFFSGVERAAYYKTDKGVLEVIFFPDKGAEKIHVTESKEGNRYIYTFVGQPAPKPSGGDSFNSSKPMYFITYENALVIVWSDRELFDTLKASLERDQ